MECIKLKSTIFIVAALCGLLTLTGCEFMNDHKDTAIGAAKGASAIAEAKDIHQQIIDYIGGDEQAMAAIKAPAAFFNTGVEFIGRDLDAPIGDIIEAQPQYVDDIPAQWAAGVQALTDYAERSGKSVPQSIIAWKDNAEAGWEQAQKAERIQQKLDKVVELYRMVKPFAMMAGLPL